MKAALMMLIPAMLLALADAQPSPTSQAGCESGYGFLEQITLEQVSLPQGISLSALEADGDSRAGIKLENETGEILLVLSLRYQEQLAQPATPDPTYSARLRFAHEVASYLVPPEGTRPLELDMTALLDLDPNLQELNNMSTPRPVGEGAVMPEAQQSMLLMMYADQVLEVPFTITYALNPGYSFDGCAQQGTGSAALAGDVTRTPAEKSAGNPQRSLPGLALLVLVVAVWLLANLLARLTRRL